MTLYDFLSGAVSFGYLVCALLFLRFWKRTADELFIAFAVAFGLLGVGQAAVALAKVPTEQQGSLYLLRLAAFAIIIFAILRKNRKSRA